MKIVRKNFNRLLFLFLLLVLCGSARAQSVAPMQGLGSVQFLSNTGVPLTSGVLYSYQAGTTTQQATYTDSTGLVQNPNPVTFTTGARATIWLTVGAFYKFVLCVQNDGSSCAPGDVLFSVDQVPGGSTSSGGGGSSPFTGTFISGSPSPATSGILRLATSDQICWRNQAGSTNICLSKNSSDLLSWPTALEFPENPAPSGCSIAGFECLWADSTAHRWLMTNGVGSTANVVGSGVDINTSDQVTQLHFGSSAIPLCGSAPSTNQFLAWNGTQACWTTTVAGQNVTVYNTTQALSGAGLGNTTMTTAPGGNDQNYLFTIYVTQTALSSGCSASPTVTPKLIYEDWATLNVITVFMPQIFSPGTFGTLGLGGATLGQMQGSWQFRAKAGTNIFYSIAYTSGTGCGSQGTYSVAPNLVQQ